MTIQQAIELGIRHQEAGETARAAAIYRQVLAQEPQHADALNLLGLLEHQAGNNELALQLLRQAISIRPDDGIYHYNVGLVLYHQRQLQAARAAYEQAIRLEPRLAAAHYNYGLVLHDLGRLDGAIEAYRSAVRLNPDAFEAHVNLGLALEAADRCDEAVRAYQGAIRLKASSPEAQINLGNAQLKLGRVSAARDAFETAIRVSQSSQPLAHCNLAMTMLLQGEYRDAWAHYERRLELVHPGIARREFAQPRWAGQGLAGQRILLYPEQGFGDILQFVRYTPMVAALGGRVTLESPPELARLLRRIEQVERLVAPGEGRGGEDFDLHCPMLSLPLLFGTTLGTIPTNVPYLSADPDLSSRWRSRLPQDGRLKVGLVWAGRDVPELKRAIDLQSLAPLSAAPDVWFCSLQVGEIAQQARTPPAGMQLTDFGNELRDFADTAAIIDNLDLLVSIDTAAAHLAGALGKPVWILLPFNCDWRWMLDRDDSPWYPTARLFRQPRPGDWATPIRQAAEALRRFKPAAH